jgi:O-antigen biosynthesis protein
LILFTDHDSFSGTTVVKGAIMLLSVFTPTNDFRWIQETYDSLVAQTHPEWEWVLVVNGGANIDDLPQAIRSDARVRILPSAEKGVGALKRYACSSCKGAVLVELDHDDQLTPTALEDIKEAAIAEPNGFYYSDFVSVFPDGRSEVYGPAFGWEGYPFSYNEENFTAMRAFDPNARALCEIYYAPNHVRAWGRTAYDIAGGHDSNLPVGDDHDLVCRTYLTGVHFVHIPKVLYIYRSHPDSTCRRDNLAIQQQQRENMNRYVYPLVYEECRRRGLSKFDLGGGSPKLDFKPLPLHFDGFAAGMAKLAELQPNSVGCFWAADVLQRIPMTSIGEFFNLVYRALAPGGWLFCQVPSTDDGQGLAGRGAFQDPGHISFWNPNSPWYYTHRDYAKHVKGYRSRFQLVRSWVEYPSPWHKANFIPYLFFDMYALKGQRAAGLSTI